MYGVESTIGEPDGTGLQACSAKLPMRGGDALRPRPDAPRILLVRPDHLGDVLLTLPAVAALRRSLPRARITFAVPRGVGAIPRRCPHVDDTRELAFPVLADPLESPGWREVVACQADGLRGCFDVAILPRSSDPWSGRLVAAAGTPIRVGHAHPSTLPYLTAALPFPGDRHVVQEALDACSAAATLLGCRSLGAPAQSEPSLIRPTPADEVEADAVLAMMDPAARDAPLLLHPGSRSAVKNWPPHRWGELAAALRRRHDVVPLVVGGPDERALVNTVVGASGGCARALVGPLSLGGLAALQRRARLVIATDSGPLHLAALVGAPVVGLYGPAHPLQYQPWCPPDRRRVVRAQLPCSPCGAVVAPPCGASSSAPCVLAIEVGAVLDAATELLEGAVPGPPVERDTLADSIDTEWNDPTRP